MGGGSWDNLFAVTQRFRLMEQFHLELSQREIELWRVTISKLIHNSLAGTSHMASPNQKRVRKCSFTVCKNFGGTEKKDGLVRNPSTRITTSKQSTLKPSHLPPKKKMSHILYFLTLSLTTEGSQGRLVPSPDETGVHHHHHQVSLRA